MHSNPGFGVGRRMLDGLKMAALPTELHGATPSDTLSGSTPKHDLNIGLVHPSLVLERYLDRLVSLYGEAFDDGAWPKRNDAAGVARMLASKGTLAVCIAVDTARSELAGFGTVVGDPLDPLIEDVVVARARKGQKIGSRILEAIVNVVPLNQNHAQSRTDSVAADSKQDVAPTSISDTEKGKSTNVNADTAAAFALVLDKLRQSPRMDLYCRCALMPFYEKNGFKAAREPANDKALMRRQRVLK